MYRKWPEAMPEWVEVRPVQFPGRQSRFKEPPWTSGSKLVEAITDAIERCLDKPFAFFGHSMGAQLSFEVTRLLRRRRRPIPRLLFVSARRAPQLESRCPPIFELPDGEFVEELRRLYNPSDLAWSHPDLVKIMLPVVRADMAICDSYVYTTEPPLDCPIRAYGGRDDFNATFEDLDAWRQQTTSTFELEMYPGGHFFLDEVLHQIQRAIKEELAARMET